ncbi:MAG: YbfB/YjiJ family MFS transporter [Castellaniella sp.]|uniref:YbfB/YjiJ family MFS transporter n=1 Tax=Castellaniella sp. TaxID=1955812 RepID=UPI002A36E264|nr:YbfB/YjiJ family MFS transporter [Castellaniella sp.]MDY0308568.1 YbfB/YjiJ family MFS transporter [Castellaniella sp.]
MAPHPFRIPLPLAGLLALAVAMGIGRFAFTPVLPMMQADLGLSLAQGSWLASANYLGYLLGALLVTHLNWSPATLLRLGLWMVVLVTAAMGLDSHWLGWLAWRLLAGVASAWVLIGTSALCIARLNATGQAERSGLVFAGVGCGIAFAGLACMGLTLAGTTASHAWLWLAAAALGGLLGASMLWRTPETPQDAGAIAPPAAAPDTAGTTSPPSPARAAMAQDPAYSVSADAAPPLHWGLILCYGVYGFGYILPATFLPAQARLLVPDPWLFSLAWPVFGLAGAVSTVVASRLARRYTRPQIWAGAQVVMAVGVLAPAVWHALPAILLAACCVGSTFMVITMVGLQEAQVAVGQAGAKRQMAAMTASFALGQLIGPIFFSLTHTGFGASLEFALVLGALGLLAGAVPILRLQATGQAPASRSKAQH